MDIDLFYNYVYIIYYIIIATYQTNKETKRNKKNVY